MGSVPVATKKAPVVIPSHDPRPGGIGHTPQLYASHLIPGQTRAWRSPYRRDERLERLSHLHQMARATRGQTRAGQPGGAKFDL